MGFQKPLLSFLLGNSLMYFVVKARGSWKFNACPLNEFNKCFLGLLKAQCWCLSLISTVVLNTMTTMGRKVFVSPYVSRSILKGGTCRQEGHGATLLAGFVLWVFSAFFLIQPRPNCPGVTPPAVGWVLPGQSLIKEIPHRFAYKAISWRDVLKRGPLFPKT